MSNVFSLARPGWSRRVWFWQQASTSILLRLLLLKSSISSTMIFLKVWLSSRLLDLHAPSYSPDKSPETRFCQIFGDKFVQPTSDQLFSNCESTRGHSIESQALINKKIRNNKLQRMCRLALAALLLANTASGHPYIRHMLPIITPETAEVCSAPSPYASVFHPLSKNWCALFDPDSGCSGWLCCSRTHRCSLWT